jgi:hypothetical protein
MTITQSDEVLKSLQTIEALQEDIRDAGLRMLEAGGGALYTIDIVAIAALNRALSLTSSFGLLLERRNFVSAAVLLRVQLDNALRFSALWRVANPDEIARQIIKGTSVRDILDREGKKLTDRRLVELFEKDKSWVPEVYEKTSGFVHLSDAHVAHSMSGEPNDDGHVPFKISAEDEYLPDQTYHEAIGAFGASTDLFLELIENWTSSKGLRSSLATDATEVGHVNDADAIIPKRTT